MSALPSLDKEKACAKCGATPNLINTRYCAFGVSTMYSVCYHVETEHMHRTCVTCRYEWLEAPIAASPPADSDIEYAD